jgi:hypothetical protein
VACRTSLRTLRRQLDDDDVAEGGEQAGAPVEELQYRR